MSGNGSNQFGGPNAKTLYTPPVQCQSRPTKLMKTSRLFSLLSLLLLAGCTHTTLTNLTLGTVPRNASGFYPVEIIWENTETTLRPETIQPVVIVGTNLYPMKRTPLVTNRWQTLVPVGAKSSELRYRVKINWMYNAVPVPAANSQLSQEFMLRIKD